MKEKKLIRRLFIIMLLVILIDITLLVSFSLNSKVDNNELINRNAAISELKNDDIDHVAPSFNDIFYSNFIKINNYSKNINYAFITDLHVSESNLLVAETTLNTLVDLANTINEIDFICLGGDLTNGQFESKRDEFDLLTRLFTPLKRSKKPVLVVNGNHDDNSYGKEKILKKEWNDFLSYYLPKNCHYMDYDNMSNYYYDLYKNGQKSRLFCLDSSCGTKSDGKNYLGITEEQCNWLEKAIKDVDQCIILSHMGPSYDFNCHFNNPHYSNKLVDICEKNKEKILSYSFGHMHSALLLCKKRIKYSCTSSAFFETTFDGYNNKNFHWQNIKKIGIFPNNFNFDVFSTAKTELYRIGVGSPNNRLDSIIITTDEKDTAN